MRRISFVTTMCTALAAMGVTTTARAQGTRTITCESAPYPAQCRVPMGSHVQLAEQLSHSPCRLNQTWGIGRDYVWVRDGCRARFSVTGGWDGGYGNGGYGNGGYGDHDRYGRRDDDRRRDVYHDRDDDHWDRGNHSGWDRGRGPDRGDDRSWHGTQERARHACARAASGWHARVDGFGDWSRTRRGMLSTQMYVRGDRGSQWRVSCVYDPARDAATLSR
ncbi:MAG TPA: DUF3011 domain-containing protein [Gemmatimonadaceae bacterium]|nr:DUF3011 domain-containing protein [Gemmatimonadaceae bacterium]